MSTGWGPAGFTECHDVAGIRLTHMHLALLLSIFPLAAQVSVTTYQYDNTRAGTNTNETILTPSNVNQTQFGKLFSYPLDGQAYAQPLYLPNLSIGGVSHNVVFVATENDSVYAFDADSAQTLWHASFLINGATTVPSSDVSCGQITPQIGITSTPVIDPSTNTLYVVAMTKESGNYVHRLHALDVTTGVDKAGSPVVIQASVAGTGDGGSTVTLVPKNYKQRPGLLLLNGVVYLGMSSHCDIGTYHGWLIGYDEQSLKQVAVYNDTPNGAMGSFWAGGAAPAADSAGNIYVVSGNGTFSAASSNFGESYLKLNSGNLIVADYFTPFNFASLDAADLDTGSAGVALLGDEAGSPAHPHLMAGAGKEGRIYLIDRDNLGKWQAESDAVVQSIPNAISGLFGNAAYFNHWVYFCAGVDQLRAYPISNATLGTPVASQFTFTNLGCVPTVSANGTSNGIVWALDTNSHTLRAFDASNVANALWDSGQNSQRDAIDSVVKFSAPMVAHGKVYAATNDALYVFGLLSPAAAISIVNAASFQAGLAAPGSLIAISGSALASSTASAAMFPLPLSLGGASVTIGGLPAPLLYASAGQINAQVPFETPVGMAMVTVNGNTSSNLAIAPTAPGVFSLVAGQAAAVNLDGTVNGPAHPVGAGGEIAVYVTGLGAVSPGVGDGVAASLNILSYVNATVSATVAGQPAKVIFSGLAPGYAGFYQVNVIVPSLASGVYPLQLTAGGVMSNSASVSVQ
jgi:uncharacterized protein (TIGR03437 family)